MRQPQRSERRHGFGNGPSAVRADSPRSFTSADGAWIDETVRVRDLHQFEIKLNYPLARDQSVTSYDLECFIFVPHSLGVHGANYSKAHFYDDLRAHIRFKTPTVPLTRIADEAEGPLANLRNNLILWQETSKEGDVGAFEYRTKLFCCILQSSLRDFVAFIDEVADPDDHDRLVRHFLDATAAITESYRALRRQVFLPSVPRHVRDIHAFGDEYVSLLVERSCYDLLRHVLDGGDNGVDELSRDVMDAIAREVGYRESRQYPSVPRDKSDNEQLVFRRNVLKLNMILRYGTQDNVRYKRLRIVLNRRRIKRIETVSVEDE